MSPACAQPMARRSSAITCRRGRIRWWSGSSARAASSSPSRTRRSSAPAAHVQRGVRPHPQSVEHVADLRRLHRRRRRRLATGEVWLAHGTDHGGACGGPATYCSVVGIRPSPGRVTRGTANNLFSPLSVQGPMARNIPDLALFLDTMAGLCPRDPLTFEAPAASFAARAGRGDRRRAHRLHRGLRRRHPDRPRDAGDLRRRGAPLRGTWLRGRGIRARPRRRSTRRFMVLRSQHFVVDRELQMQTHRDLLKPDIIWNTEQGLAQTPSRIAWAERERAASSAGSPRCSRPTNLRLAQRRDACLRREAAASRACRRQEARRTTWAPRAERGGDDGQLPGGGGAVRLRSVRPPGRPAGRGADPARRRARWARLAVRAAHRPRPAVADRPARRSRAPP